MRPRLITVLTSPGASRHFTHSLTSFHWENPIMTRDEIETALDTGRVQARMANGRLWACRRNGKTQTWKTRPGHFCIPVKMGFRSHGYITPDAVEHGEIVITPAP